MPRLTHAAAVILLVLLPVGCAKRPAPTAGKPGLDTTKRQMIPIVNKQMTEAEIAGAIVKEGQVNVANWTYLASETLARSFEKFVESKYGVKIKCNYVGRQTPESYLVDLRADYKADKPPTYDVMAIEVNYYYEAKREGMPLDFLPSPLAPNLKMVDPAFQFLPQAAYFQSTAFGGIVYDEKRAGFLKDWTDLADPRLKGKLVLAEAGDITSACFLVGLCWSLGGDMKKPADMERAIEFAVKKVHPNVVKYTTDPENFTPQLTTGAILAAMFWNSRTRLLNEQGHKSIRFLWARSGMVPANGVVWIPKGTRHPILAQLFFDYELSPERQIPPESWGLSRADWVEFHEGLLGPAYREHLPEWLKGRYDEVYPSLDYVRQMNARVEWEYVSQHFVEWGRKYQEGLAKQGR